MPKLGIKEHEIVKISKKGDFRNFFGQFLGFTLKRVPKIGDSHILWKPFGTKFMIDCKTEIVFSWFLIGYHFQLKKDQ